MMDDRYLRSCFGPLPAQFWPLAWQVVDGRIYFQFWAGWWKFPPRRYL